MNQPEMNGAATRRAIRHHVADAGSNCSNDSSLAGVACSRGASDAVQGTRYQPTLARSWNSKPSPLYKAQFTAAWLPDDMILEGFTDGLLWKRWGMPKFTFEQAQRLFPRLPGLAYNAATDSFTMPHSDHGPTEKEVFAGEAMTIDGNTITLYAIGAGSWCWDPPAPMPLR